MAELSSAPVKRLLVESSGGMRVGGSALDLAVAEAEKFLRLVGQTAGKCAADDRRKTILDGDIVKAVATVGLASPAPAPAPAAAPTV